MIMERKRPERRHFNWFVLLMGGVIIYFSSILVSQQVYLHQVAEDQAAAEARLATTQAEIQEREKELSSLAETSASRELALKEKTEAQAR